MFSFFNYEHDLLEAMRNEHQNKSVVLHLQLQQKIDESQRNKNMYSELKAQIRDYENSMIIKDADMHKLNKQINSISMQMDIYVMTNRSK